uniref:Alpha-L-iduronidase n=1 Tax=Anopheles farauti TaxID=69004 RepID=A0A182R0K6_9DIPT
MVNGCALTAFVSGDEGCEKRVTKKTMFYQFTCCAFAMRPITTMWTLLLLFLLLLECLITSESHPAGVGVGAAVRIHQGELAAAGQRNMKPFWTGSGLCPPEPRNASGEFLLSKDSLTNLELIGSLTNRSISHVRIHWLLELLGVSQNRYNFTMLDTFLDHLHHTGLVPGFELMGTPLGSTEGRPYSAAFWTDLVQQLVERYAGRYGVRYVSRWRFETWNEPDLRNYNTLNFTLNDYLSYVFAIRHGLNAMRQKYDSLTNTQQPFALYGPAGLFKSDTHHPFCWTVMEYCGANDTTPQSCPFDTITFHRKGSGRWASEVLDGGRQLVRELLERFPNTERLRFANDEADPIASWSTARPFKADVRYAATLFSIVTQHWSAIADGDEFGRRLQFLSHDNAFLSYYPRVFEQRTLLARFQMNRTDPPHVQFVAKPVFSVLGMLAKLGPFATPTRYLEGNVSYVVSCDKRRNYLCLLASRSNDTAPMWVKRSVLNVTIPTEHFRTARVSYLIEALQDGLNDPFRVWQRQRKPAYPTTAQLASMRAVQLPSVLNEAPHVVELENGTKIELQLNLRGPWVVSVRVCAEKGTQPGRVDRVRVRTVFRDEVLIFWKLSNGARCIYTYEVWFKPSSAAGRWCHVNVAKHTPFMFYQYASNVRVSSPESKDCRGVQGSYKVRAVDLFGRKGPFSSAVYYN